MKRTRIVATIGPACASVEKLIQLFRAGVNVTRLNFSHGTYAEHTTLLRLIRAAARRTGKNITILQDLSGPKIRVGDLPPAGIELRVGKTYVLSNNPKRREAIPFQYNYLPQDVHKGDRILFDDGLLEAEVVSTTSQEVAIKIIVGGTLLAHKGINVPTASLRVGAITPKDKRDLQFGLAHGVDVVALSFVRGPRDIQHLRDLIVAAKSGYKPLIIAKIEKHEAVANLEGILHAADGVMVARGDLGIEIPAEQVPIVQKEIIRRAVLLGKPVIVATQMLDSMIRNPRPTRAEVSDVANAVFDATDGVMLSGETATGKYPVETVAMMNKIICTVENSGQEHVAHICQLTPDLYEDQLVGELAIIATQLHTAAGVLIPYDSRELAKIISKFRPPATIFVQTKTALEAAQLNMCYGICALVVKSVTEKGGIEALARAAKKHKYVKRGDTVVSLRQSKGKERLLSADELQIA